ncbi:glycosyltransferase family 2 protein [Peristeroidobacter agariperforans]|uniref:glycosyltransferase family 2 protein n=1 Tax=Peristeroidobacter agariperforans TaxID=268404 RepID=UPI0018E5292D|nr:glycosyltransferase family 2 protein [Peristeroidobacter agariperforans]
MTHSVSSDVRRMQVSIVIPVFNAETNLPELYRQLMPAMESLVERFEVIMVEDGSRDRSWDVISALSARDPRVRGFRMSRNYGQHNALLCGIRAAKYGVILTMDDDLQHPVSEISLLLQALLQGHDVVYGSSNDNQHDLWRNVASRMTKLALQRAMGASSASQVSAFRAFPTRLRDAFHDYRSPSVSIDALLTWATTRFTAVSVKHAPRLSGTSNYTVRKLITHAFNLMTGFSTMPLKLASVIGFGFTLFGFAVLAWVLGRYFIQGTSVPGFPFLASLIAIFSGAQMFTLGIFGEYLARMYGRSMERPTYVVLETSEQSAEPANVAHRAPSRREA